MFSLIKAVPEAVKHWRDNGAMLYDLVAAISAVSVILSIEQDERPAVSLALGARFVGLGGLADSFTGDGPPILASSSIPVRDALVAVVLALFGWMALGSSWRGRHDGVGNADLEPRRLLRSPVAATPWVLLAVAAQEGPLGPVLHHWGQRALTIALLAVLGVVAIAAVYFLVDRQRDSVFARSVVAPALKVSYRLLIGEIWAAIAILLAPLALPLKVVTWMVALESDRGKRVREELDRQRFERTPLPTGAQWPTPSC